MKDKGKRTLLTGVGFLAAFSIFTYLLQRVDVKPLGVNGTEIGFASINCGFHRLCGVHMTLYTVTDWLGLVPIFVALLFGCIGFAQMLKRRSLLRVDGDLLVLGVYYLLVIGAYLVFEKISINYRPVLINGVMEGSYPSSTTLLVLAVMPTLTEQVGRRCRSAPVKRTVNILALMFTGFMVVGRLLSGVHWLSDILGSVLISRGLFSVYKGFVLRLGERE